ncbi:FadR/GntR family transcriptional regulator [Pseudahrensia aquimaris]|uniref:FadR/GntR family transcriptional regulator n=1 Tax=Pseudahrensia aquimaris TaxID=744461 RepID=A0ABW3FAB1_9HYPH
MATTDHSNQILERSSLATDANGARKTQRVAEVETKLREAIASGRYPVGSRLPTETELTESLNVSRSVLREAVAALRSQGLLRSQQGAGVFVLRDRAVSSPLGLLTEASATISDVIEELELRTAVEIEAAGLASKRGSPAQLAEIESCHTRFGAALDAGDRTEEIDSAFHRAIARATNNARFSAFLSHMGERTIPRAAIQARLGREALPRRDIQLHEEHAAIVRAIIAQDEDGARTAMRDHLGGAMLRYRQMIHG